MNKGAFETMCRNAGLMPVERSKIEDTEILIADGKTDPPHRNFRKFGLEAHEFPDGAYVTLWLACKGDQIDTGTPMFFDINHNPEMEHRSRQQARINRALHEAAGYVSSRKRVQLNG